MPDLTVTAHDRLELAVRDHGGDGPDVVLLHGVHRTLEDWVPVLQYLEGVRAVAMDLRFHGRSGVPETANVDDFVRDVDAVVEHLALSDPIVVGHSFGGVLAMGYAAAHPDCPGVVNIDGFDFRQRELYDDLDPAEVDRFLEGFKYFVPSDAGDDAWLEEQRETQRQLDEAWRIPDDVADATAERAFVRTADGWERRPPSRFFDVVSGAAADDMADYPLTTLRRITCPMVFVACRPPDARPDMYDAARRGVERHVTAIAAEKPNVRLATIDASHGVIFEQPAEIAAIVRSLL